MNVGAKIKERRKELNLTVDEIAKILGKDRSTIYRYESNDIENLPTSVLEPLAKALNTTPALLLGWGEHEYSDHMIDEYHDFSAEMLDLLEDTGYSYEEIEKFDQIIICKNNFNQTFNFTDLVSDYIKLKKPETIIMSLLSEKDSSNKVIESYEKLSGDGKTFVSKTINNLLYYESKQINDDSQSYEISYTEHPIYLLPVSAGTGQFLDGEDFEMIPYPSDFIPKGSNFGVRVSGDSMEPQLHEGDTVFIQRSKEIESGNIGVFILNGEAFIKKMIGDMDGCYLVSLNQKYKPIKIRESDNLKTIGKVLGVN
ncbi:MAG: LexA family transcriptional regulator [Eubacteriaceae bacterium]|nr:LexA family transcriptional regulator [Eubacteriaceae bacterium]